MQNTFGTQHANDTQNRSGINRKLPPSTSQYTDLVRVHDVLDSMYWKIIPYDYFNRIQSATCDALLHSTDNIVVSAPTVALLLSFSPGLWQNGSRATSPSTSTSTSFPYSIVYVCPTKALCNEIFTKWSSTFASLGLRCVVGIGWSVCCRKSLGTRTLWSLVKSFVDSPL